MAACLLACLPSPLRDAYQPMLHLAWWMMLPLAIVGGIVAIGAAVYFRFWFLRGFNAPDFNPFEFSPGTDEQRLLVLNTHEDEAFQLLARIMQLPNPFHSLSDRWWPRVLLRHFCQWWPSAFTEAKKRDFERFPRQSCTLRLFLYTGLALPALRVWISSAVTPSRLFADALTGIEFGWIIVALIWIAIQPKAAIAEISFPVRFCRFFSSLLTSSLREVGVLFFRMKGWGYLKRRALGLEGYPLEEPGVGLEPSSLSKPYYHFERVPGAVIGDALAKRQTHVNRSLALVTKALAHREFTIGDIDPLLKSIAEDTTLVHSVCYLSDSVINVVARWLAKTETEIESDARARFNTEISGEYNYYTPDPPRDLYWR